MMGISPKTIGFKRQKPWNASIRALAATATGAAALVAVAGWTQPLMAQGTMSEYAKTPGPAPAPASSGRPAQTGAQAQAQAPAVPLPTQRPATPPAAGKAQAPAGAAKQQAPASPVGSGSGWQANVQPGGQQPADARGSGDNSASILKVNAYFNALKTLNGVFLQTESDNTQKKGKFYMERPGKIRFDYANPSKLHIISDGEYLAIEDHDLGTTDRYPIDSTPFRLLLTKDVDLLRDARILGVIESDSALIIALEDKSQNTSGQIRLFFNKPDFQLKEWIITDPQGLNTKVTISDAEVNKSLSADLFKFSTDVGMPSFNR
jgi:outer membrane lipoprotein-sorting protein